MYPINHKVKQRTYEASSHDHKAMVADLHSNTSSMALAQYPIGNLLNITSK